MSIRFTKPYFPDDTRRDILADVDRILVGGQLIEGDFAHRLEAFYADLTKVAHARAVNTCTTALTLCCRYFDVAGREVLVPSASFVTDISAIIDAGGKPVLVDIDPNTLSFDLDDLASKCGPRTRGIVWVHLTGMISPDYQRIVAFARDNGLFLIEDAAHAHGAEVDGRTAGGLADAACFSFYATKVMTAGTGGLITTDDADLAHFVDKMRAFGKDPKTGRVEHASSDFLLNEVSCCIAYHHSLILAAQLAARRSVASRYIDGLRNQPGLRVIAPPTGNRPAYYQFPTFVGEDMNYHRLRTMLSKDHGVPCKPIYKPTHEEVPFRNLDDGTLRATEQALNRSLCLPMRADMSDDEVDTVIAAVTSSLRAAI